MKKRLLTLGAALLATVMGYAQTPLPTSYNFDNFASTANLPLGWTSNISGTFTYAGGALGTPLAAKLDLQGEYVQIQTTDPIGLTTYYMKGTGTAPWQGVFKVEESVDGVSWTQIIAYGNAQPQNVTTTGYVQYSVTPNINSRYLRFNFSTKVSGYNMGLDEINLSAAVITSAEINIKQGTTTILSGGTSSIFGSAVGTPLPVTFTVENQGTVNTLNLNSVSITGPAAADYSVSLPTFPTTVSPSSNIPLTLSFVPSAAGTRNAVLTINNDDSNEGTYVINLYGVGGTLASEPTAQATNLSFNNIKSYRAYFSFSAAAGSPEGYLVIKKISASPITDLPVDGTTYTRGDYVGSSKVVYSGTTLADVLYEVTAAQQYQLAVFTYNGAGTFRNYNTTNPLTGTFTSLGSMMPAAEYNGINTSSPTFLTDLSARIYPHQSVFYSNYDETMVRLFTARDTTAGQKFVTCVYSGENYVYTEPFDYSYMSREHSYCHNWMPTNPADGSGAAPNNFERKEYNDQHHLFPTNQNDVNARRSNYPMGKVVTQTGTYLGCKWGQDALGHFVFEPRDQHKGDFARAVMYIATCYNGQNDAFGVPQNWKFRNPISGTIAYGQDQNILKTWHYQDPPDAYEIARNDFLDSLQGNRNPFIDSVQFACFIDFSNMTQLTTTSCSAIGLKDNSTPSVDFSIFPNPSTGTFSVLLNTEVSSDYTINVIDITGRIIETQSVKAKQGGNFYSFTNKVLPAGAYAIEITSATSKSVKKLIVQ